MSIKPSKKSDSINNILQKIMGGKSRVDIIKTEQCMFCDTPNTNFRDDLSKKEYSISGLCQDCQDKTFETER